MCKGCSAHVVSKCSTCEATCRWLQSPQRLGIMEKERRPMLPVCRTSSTKCNELNVALSNMICANNLPFSQAESAFFQNIATVLRPILKPPLAKWLQLNCRRIPMLLKNNEDGTHVSLFCFLFSYSSCCILECGYRRFLTGAWTSSSAVSALNINITNMLILLDILCLQAKMSSVFSPC